MNVDIHLSSSASKLHRIKNTIKKIKGDYITKVGSHVVQISADVQQRINECQDTGGKFSITFALKPAMNAKQLKKGFEEFDILVPTSTKEDK